MQIYFLGSISVADKMMFNYTHIIETLQFKGHQVWYEHVINRSQGQKDEYPISDDKDYYRLALSRINHSDAVFIEASHLTVNLGYEVAYALENNIPVVAFHLRSAEVSPFFKGNTSPHFYIYEYTTVDKLEGHIDLALGEVESRLKRSVTFPVNAQTAAYLEWVNRNKRMSRSTFVSGLLDTKMRRDKTYKEFLKTEKRKNPSAND